MSSSTFQVTNHEFPASRIEWRSDRTFAESVRTVRSALKTPRMIELLFYSKMGGRDFPLAILIGILAVVCVGRI